MSDKAEFTETHSDKELPENLTTCPICVKIMKIPKCLPCFHSMCADCLHSHIMKSTIKGKYFDCPVCGQRTLPKNSDSKREDWAKQFKSNHLIDSVMDAFEMKKGDRKCDPCKNMRKRSMGVTWCTTCRETLCSACTISHQGMRLTRQHVVIELSKIKNQPVADIIKDERCPDHDDQLLQFYCKDHREQSCSTCAIAKHRQCKEVIEMQKLGKEIRSQQKMEKLLKRLNACLETQHKVIEAKKTVNNSMKTKRQDILNEIRDLKQKIIDLLTNMETAFTKEFDKLHETKQSEMQNGIEETERLSKAINYTVSVLNAALSYGSDNQLFMIYEKFQDECRKYEKSMVENNKEPKGVSYSFKMDERLKAIANNVKKFGHFSVNNETPNTKPFKVCFVRETAIFGAKTPYDDIRGIDIFVNGDVILSDRINQSVMLFHSNGEFVSHLNFQSRPWGVAVLGVRTACVSLPDCKEIHIIKSSYRRLDDYRTISTSISCFAVTNFSGEYLTIQHKEEKEEKGRVTIAQSDKQISHKSVIDITCNHEHIQGIAYDEATSKIFVATDFDALECYNARGRILFRNSYDGCGDFRGVCVDRQSNVYIASYSGKGVLQLSHEGEKIRMISTSPLAPLDVAISPRGNKMLVSGRSDLVYIYAFE